MATPLVTGSTSSTDLDQGYLATFDEENPRCPKSSAECCELLCGGLPDALADPIGPSNEHFGKKTYIQGNTSTSGGSTITLNGEEFYYDQIPQVNDCCDPNGAPFSLRKDWFYHSATGNTIQFAYSMTPFTNCLCPTPEMLSPHYYVIYNGETVATLAPSSNSLMTYCSSSGRTKSVGEVVHGEDPESGRVLYTLREKKPESIVGCGCCLQACINECGAFCLWLICLIPKCIMSIICCPCLYCVYICVMCGKCITGCVTMLGRWVKAVFGCIMVCIPCCKSFFTGEPGDFPMVHLDEEKGGLVQENKTMMFSSDEMDDEPVASVTQIKVSQKGAFQWLTEKSIGWSIQPQYGAGQEETLALLLVAFVQDTMSQDMFGLGLASFKMGIPICTPSQTGLFDPQTSDFCTCAIPCVVGPIACGLPCAALGIAKHGMGSVCRGKPYIQQSKFMDLIPFLHNDDDNLMNSHTEEMRKQAERASFKRLVAKEEDDEGNSEEEA